MANYITPRLSPTSAQPSSSILSPTGATSEKRLALVLAVQNYENLPKLANTLADADLIGSKLRNAGFAVEVEKDVSRIQLQRAIRQFGRTIQAAGPDAVALVYYAGHGVQDEKQTNYMVGVDAELSSDIDLPIEAMPFNDILRTLGAAKPKFLVAIFDACHDNPLPSSRTCGASRGLAPENDLPPGLLIAYSTKPGGVAEEGPSAGHSPYAQALAEEIDASGVEIERTFQVVTPRPSSPRRSGSLTTAWSMVSPPSWPPIAVTLTSSWPRAAEKRSWGIEACWNRFNPEI